MIYKCLNCGKRFDSEIAVVEHYIGGESERFCPFCGSDELEDEGYAQIKGPAH